MIKISKLSPPDKLKTLQEQARERYLSPEDAYRLLDSPTKHAVMSQLIEEQGHLCAYCMRRIPDDRPISGSIPKTSLEHWYPRNPPPSHPQDIGQGLDYGNMLAVCSGNKGTRGTRKRRDLTCDARRNETNILTVNPLDEKTLVTIYYKDNGEIAARDASIHDDLTRKLNLNCNTLTLNMPKARADALAPVQSEVYELVATKSRDEVLDFCRTRLSQFESETTMKTPFVGIIIWWLKDFIQVSTQNTAN